MKTPQKDGGRRWRGLLTLAAFGAFALLLPGGGGEESAAPREEAPAAPDGPAFFVESPDTERMGGVSLVAPRAPLDAGALGSMERVGAGWVAILPYAFLLPEDGGIRYDAGRQMWGETPEGIRETARLAEAAGLRVFLKPHVWGRGGWIGDYEAASEEGWLRFEAGYRDYILTMAHLADSLGVGLLAVGTEADRVAIARPGFWRSLIAEVRAIYPGPLTYAANWDEWESIPFWDALDYIGVDAYFPLSAADTPSVESLLQAWIPHVAALRRESLRYGKPILFAEFGYRSIDGTAGRQWELPPERSRSPEGSGRENLRAQTNAYEALFRAVWSEPWFAGGFLWKWYPADEAWRERPNDHFTPQHKPVESVIRRWFGGEAG